MKGHIRVSEITFKLMPIADAIDALLECQDAGDTHASFKVSHWEPKPKKPRKGYSDEPAKPGKIRLHGVEGTIREFSS